MSREAMLERLLDLAVEEDVGPGDWTTRWTVEPGLVGEAEIVAKEELVVAGTGVATRVFHRVDPDLAITVDAPDGTRLNPEDQAIHIRGPLCAILTGERIALNFLGRLSGVATLTSRYVARVAGTSAKILDTRKTTPGWRFLEKEAVRAGGGENHRMGLHDMVLIKDNHIVAAGGVTAALEKVRNANDLGLSVEVEVGSLEELDEALHFGLEAVQRILLDNMTPREMTEAVARIRAREESNPTGRIPVEASGNVTLETVQAIAETGVDFISAGALTHSSPAADYSLRVLGR